MSDLRASLASPLAPFGARANAPRATVAAAVDRPRPRLFADPLPLRDGTELAAYRQTGVLPWVYGRVTLAPRPLDPGGLSWFVADHPCLAVHSVRDNGALISGWEAVQTLDTTGAPITTVRLARKPAGALAVEVSGRRDARTGALIAHPADIAADLLSRCGIVASPSAWAALRSGSPGVQIGGVLASAISLREALTTVIGSVGAQWSASPLRAWAPFAGASVATLGAREIDGVSATATTAPLATRLRVPWGWDWAANAPRGTVIVEAPEAIRRYGRIEAEVPAPWLRAARDALALAQATLAIRARPQWVIELRLGPGERWRPGDAVTINHPWAPGGVATITGVDWSPDARVLTAVRLAGPAPRVDLGPRTALVDAAQDGASVSYLNGVATLTVVDDAGNALAGARTTLDGTQTAHTDRLGRVQFTAARGTHTLLVSAAGYADFEMDIVL